MIDTSNLLYYHIMKVKDNIFVVGSIALDSLETINGNSDDLIGGSATYFALAAAQFSPVKVIGIVGEDFPKEGWDILNSKNIFCENILSKSGKTFRWGGRYSDDYSTRDTLFTDLGVFEDYVPAEIIDNKSTSILFLANIHPDLQLNVLNQYDVKPNIVAMDTMNLWIDLCVDEVWKVISTSDIFLLNDEEAIQLTNQSNINDAGRMLLDKGPSHVIIKKGAHGSVLIENSSTIEIPVFSDIKIMDPTGAGDSYAGGLLGYINNNGISSIADAMIYASAIASYTVSEFGTKNLINLNFSEIEKRVEVIRSLI